MKIKIILTSLILAVAISANANDLDSLKQQLQATTNDTLKGAIYTKIAAEYMKFDTILNRNVKNYYQTEAIHWSLQALHNYSYYEDTTGMRNSFDALAKVYIAQRKFSEAKWFLLQSTNISKRRKDIPATINSLIQLSLVKVEIKENKLALRDLNEALNLSVKNKMPAMEALVQKNFVYLYNRLDEPEKGDIAAKRLSELNEQIKAQQAIAMSGNTPATKKALPAKKKVYASKKSLKSLQSTKRLASL
ncbi:hypothetical protein ACFQZX_11465 [Mucilaginibacter litoreus]|uniref:Tetratricopeptide repeat-containing protein n=1 Tax=Mucilaginibacter litoreus TaxID=1048221 RepID=A0ABW3ATQ8_9SPHI